MNCTNCGQENPNYAAFCSNCGKPQSANPPAFEESGFKEQPAVVAPIPPVTPVPPITPVSPITPIPPANELRLWDEFGPAVPLAEEVAPQQSAIPLMEEGIPQQAVYPSMGEGIPQQQIYPSVGEVVPQQAVYPSMGEGIPQQAAYPSMGEVAPQQPTLPFTREVEQITAPLPVIRTPWTRALERRFGVLAKPLPILATIIAIVVVALLLIVLQVTGSDWAAGAKSVAVAAGIIALLILLITGVRTLAGMRRRQHFIFVGISVLILVALCIGGFAGQSSIHNGQARFLEGQQQWQAAITEYRLAGQQAPTSVDIARTYAEWGEQLNTASQYNAAISKFNTVLNDYIPVTSEVIRAQSDEVAAYLALGKNTLQQQNYAATSMYMDTLLNLPFCNTACKTQASALDATAYYNTAEMELGSQQYSQAISIFQLILNRFPTSPEAQKLHPEFAKALLGQGQQQLTSDCSSAIPTYQQLMQSFADTPQGQQAIRALQAPQPIKGRFVGTIPQDPTLTPLAVAAKNLSGTMTSAQFGQALNGAPATNVNSDGTFIFKPLQQGTYDLAWGTIRNTGSSSFDFKYNIQDNQPIYVASVGPLCAYNFGDINENIPTAP